MTDVGGAFSVGSVTPGPVVQGYVRKQAGQASEQRSPVASASVLASGFALVSLDDGQSAVR